MRSGMGSHSPDCFCDVVVMLVMIMVVVVVKVGITIMEVGKDNSGWEKPVITKTWNGNDGIIGRK